MLSHADIDPKYQGLYIYGIYRTLCYTIQRGLWQTHPCPSHDSTERPLADTSMPQSQQYREASGRHIHAPVTTVQRGLWQTHPCPSHNNTERPLADTSMPQSQNNTERPLANTSMPQSQHYREAYGIHIHATVTTVQRGLWQTHPCPSHNSIETSGSGSCSSH